MRLNFDPTDDATTTTAPILAAEDMTDLRRPDAAAASSRSTRTFQEYGDD